MLGIRVDFSKPESHPNQSESARRETPPELPGRSGDNPRLIAAILVGWAARLREKGGIRRLIGLSRH